MFNFGLRIIKLTLYKIRLTLSEIRWDQDAKPAQRVTQRVSFILLMHKMLLLTGRRICAMFS